MHRLRVWFVLVNIRPQSTTVRFLQEHISVPNHLSAEMVPFSHHVGELRAHYAGFFDPGFGYDSSQTRALLVAIA